MSSQRRAHEPERPTAINSADPVRNFTLSVNERIRALTIGAPAWATRKRNIEDDEVRLVSKLVELHDTLAAKGKSRPEIEAAMVKAANAFDLTRINTLVAKHNRYYPIEANLPIDYRTNGYLAFGRPWSPEEPYTAARLLQQAWGEIDSD